MNEDNKVVLSKEYPSGSNNSDLSISIPKSVSEINISVNFSNSNLELILFKLIGSINCQFEMIYKVSKYQNEMTFKPLIDNVGHADFFAFYIQSKDIYRCEGDIEIGWQ